MYTTTYRTINFVKTPVSIEAKGFQLDLTTAHNKSTKLKMIAKLEKKHGEKFARFYSIKGTCPCCMREFTVNKVTGKLAHHYTKGTSVKCSGAGMEPLEISDQGLVKTIQEYIQLVDTYEMLARKSHKWSNDKKEYTAQAEVVKTVLAEKIDLLISYRDLAKIQRKAEEKAAKKAAKKAERAAARAAKKEQKAAEAAEKKTEKYIVRQAYFANRCKGTFCPKCNKVAQSKEEVQKLFGFRKKKDGTLHPQSSCKSCRAEANRRTRAKKKAALQAQVA